MKNQAIVEAPGLTQQTPSLLSKTKLKRLTDRDIIDLWLNASVEKDLEEYALAYCELRARFGSTKAETSKSIAGSLLVSLTIAAFISLQIGNFFLIASVLFLFVTSRQLVRSSRMKSKRLKDSGHEFFRLPDLANQDLRDLIKLLPKDGDAKDQIKRVLASQSKYGYDKSEWQAKHNTLLITLYIMPIVFALAMTTIVEGTVLESMRMRIAEGTKWKVTLSITALSGIIAQLVLFIRKRRR